MSQSTRFRPEFGQPGRLSGQQNPCLACDVRHLAICSSLEPTELDELRGILQTVNMDARETLFYEGDQSDFVFNLTEGALRLTRLMPDGRRQITGFLFPGDFLGLGHRDAYAYSAETLTPTVLCRFPRRQFEGMLESHPQFERRLLSVASNELAAAQEQILLLGRKTAPEKLASFLLLLSRRARRRGLTDDPVALPMSRTDIADYLGLTTETVSRTFTSFKTKGLIRILSSDRIGLTDREALTHIAEGD